MEKIWINYYNGQHKVSEDSPGESWSCLGTPDEDLIVHVESAKITDVDLTVPDDFDPSDDMF